LFQQLLVSQEHDKLKDVLQFYAELPEWRRKWMEHEEVEGLNAQAKTRYCAFNLIGTQQKPHSDRCDVT